jgi:hypothetical protein
MRATKAEEERAHYKFMAELNQSTDHSDVDKGSVTSGATFESFKSRKKKF